MFRLARACSDRCCDEDCLTPFASRITSRAHDAWRTTQTSRGIEESGGRTPELSNSSTPELLSIYLASQSPRRRALLRKAGLKFAVLKPCLVESLDETDPARFAVEIARRKVDSVERRVKSGIILGVDTIVILGRRIMGKPANKDDARRMLRALSGRTHRVICGVCLLRKPDRRQDSRGRGVKRPSVRHSNPRIPEPSNPLVLLAAETSKVKFRKLTAREIEEYVSSREPYDKAGAYAIQGRAGLFVEEIKGDYFNVVGLPVSRVLRMLNQLGS